jgi:MFS family permease
MDQWGRRKISIVANSILFLGWLLVCVAHNISVLIVAKTIEGFARSMVATTLTVSIAYMIHSLRITSSDFRYNAVQYFFTFHTTGTYHSYNITAIF